MGKFTLAYFIVFSFSIAYPCLAQQPHVDTIIKKLDSNSDGVLTETEVSKSQRYSRQFPRWDADGDGKVSKKDIVRFRAKFGIAADGSRLSDPGTDQNRQEFTIPDVSDLLRVDRNNRPSRKIAANSQYALKTPAHPTLGDRYFIITDHQSDDYLNPLKLLASHHNAGVILVKDLALLHGQTDEYEKAKRTLVAHKPKYVAIAPRLESFRENMLLGMWKLLSTLDEDPQLDCFPGILVASNAKAFEKLIDQSIEHKPINSVQPFAINQVQNSRETRSLQKSGILRKHFLKAKLNTPILAIYGTSANNAPRLEGKKVWNLQLKEKRSFVKRLPVNASVALRKANLIVMHGHGIPGMSCSWDVDGLPDDMTGKVLLTGSCFSAAPVKSDLAAMRQAPGGYELDKRDAFVVRAIDNGAIVAFGHQRLSSGFPHLYPVLENWVGGMSVGEAYQRLINALIVLGSMQPDEFVVRENEKASKRLPQNRLLYVIIGDPALQPFKPINELRPK